MSPPVLLGATCAFLHLSFKERRRRNRYENNTDFELGESKMFFFYFLFLIMTLVQIDYPQSAFVCLFCS